MTSNKHDQTCKTNNAVIVRIGRPERHVEVDRCHFSTSFFLQMFLDSGEPRIETQTIALNEVLLYIHITSQLKVAGLRIT